MSHDAFFSYTRDDDRFIGGSITDLKRQIELGVQVVTGDRNFSIFQDIDGSELGEQWKQRINQALLKSTLLIQILTPLFFRSEACKQELQVFLEHEKTIGRNDLILPIYFVTTPSLESNEKSDNDDLSHEVSKRQRFDWRPFADLPLTDPQVRKAVRELCEKMREYGISRDLG